MSEDSDDTDKTEDPSQRRLDKAHEQGDVVKSQEVNTWFLFGAATLALMSFSDSMGQSLTATMRGVLSRAGTLSADGYGLSRLSTQIGFEIISSVAIPFLLLMLAALAGNLIQHRLVWSTEGLSPKLSKISPLAGAKRLFSKQALANFLKGLVKLAVVGCVVTALLWPERNRLEGLIFMDPAAIVPLTRQLSLKLLGAVVALLAVIAAADYLFQYRQWFNRQKMSLHDVKQEHKETDGDPKIKGKLRQLRQQSMKKRMMAAVPTATVVVTNPTHFAVALKYERGMAAPICVAKGQDLIALKIRSIAQDNDVAVIENPPLARALHATVEIDQEVPPEHYKAVAEVIGYVMKLKRTFGA